MEQHLKSGHRPLCPEQSRRFFCRFLAKMANKSKLFFKPILKFFRYFNFSKLSRYG